MISMKTQYSQKLNQNITVNQDGSVKCQDGTEYSKSELKTITGMTDAGISAVHKLKFAFMGAVE